jgi:hypothetical protein
METDVFTIGTETANLSSTPEFTLGFCEVPVTQSLFFCVVYCRYLDVHLCLFLVIVLSVLRFTAPDYRSDILDLRLLITALIS